jgi:hypothetical protein
VKVSFLAEGAWKQMDAFSRSTLEIRVSEDEEEEANPTEVFPLLVAEKFCGG